MENDATMDDNVEVVTVHADAADNAHVNEKAPSIAPDVDDDEEFTVPEQRKIIRKVDRRLLIVLGLMQAVSFIDRSNVSNAAVAGMTADLKLGVSNRYVCILFLSCIILVASPLTVQSIILLTFFAPYVAFQFPAAVLVRKVGPRLFLSSIVLCWGATMIVS